MNLIVKDVKMYLDNSATTKVREEALKEMLPYFTEKYGNPSSLHDKGLEAKNAVFDAKERIAKILKCSPEELVFTGSGTESINLGILGLVNKKKHIITSKIEHPAVLETCKHLESKGFKVSYLDVDENGFISLKELESLITKDTFLISIQYANNEVGVIQDVNGIGKIAKKHGVCFHTDACQAGQLDLSVKNIDLMTLNSSKVYGPKGVGLLYVRKGLKLKPILFGGGQQGGLRSGTENVSGIIGFAKALELRQKDKDLVKLRDYMIKEILKIDKAVLNGDSKRRLPNNINVSFIDVEGESLVLLLNESEIYCSTGSACASSKIEPSHVILAVTDSHERAHSSLRVSFGYDFTKKDADVFLDVLKESVEKLRRISPL